MVNKLFTVRVTQLTAIINFVSRIIYIKTTFQLIYSHWIYRWSLTKSYEQILLVFEI